MTVGDLVERLSRLNPSLSVEVEIEEVEIEEGEDCLYATDAVSVYDNGEGVTISGWKKPEAVTS